MKAHNPHTDDYNVTFHVHYLLESDPNTVRPKAMDVIVSNKQSSLRDIADRVALLVKQPYGSIYLASCYVKGYSA